MNYAREKSALGSRIFPDDLFVVSSGESSARYIYSPRRG